MPLNTFFSVVPLPFENNRELSTNSHAMVKSNTDMLYVLLVFWHRVERSGSKVLHKISIHRNPLWERGGNLLKCKL